jgi:uncharacterized protein involved in type VI secretion and phage assembly
MSTGPRYYGKYRATVLNNVDPRNQGRIQVQLADRYGMMLSTWAMPSFPLAALTASMVALPPVMSSVWIEYEQGDPEFPIWSGSFFAEPGSLPPQVMVGATPATPNIFIQTVGGVSLTLSDNPALNVLIKTLTGAMISIGETTGITITNGRGAMITMQGPSVIINNGALTIT